MNALTDMQEPVEGFQFMALSETSAEPRPCVIQSLGFEGGTVAAVAGEPNASKTALVCDQMAHVAAGEPWFGLKVKQGPVLMFAPEAPDSVMMRLQTVASRKFPGRVLPLYICRETPVLGSEAASDHDCERVIATIRAVESLEGRAVVAITIDTVAACMGDGDENSDGMVRLVNGAKRIAATVGCLVLLIHHPSKAGSGLRGHSSLAAAVDTILAVTTDEMSKVRTATLVKSRDSATGLQLHYELEQVTLDKPDDFGDPRTTIIVKPLDSRSIRPKRPGGKSQDALLMELERRHRTGETGWDEARVREAGRGIGLHRNSASSALAGLRRAGYVRGDASNLTLTHPPEPGP